MIMAAVCAFAPQQLKAEVPGFRMDGVMGQSIEDETSYDVTPLPMLLRASTADASPSTAAVSSYTQDFLDKSFTTEGDFTDATYYHKADYEDYLMLQGIDVSWWQAKDKKTTLLDWEKIHDAGIDFTFVRAASRDSKDGSIYEDTAADSHIQSALENDMNVGLYVFSQALTEAEAKEEADYLLRQIKKYNWDITMPLVIDREKGSYNRLTEGKLSKAKETAVCQAFADTITEAGFRACVYASYAWIKS